MKSHGGKSAADTAAFLAPFGARDPESFAPQWAVYHTAVFREASVRDAASSLTDARDIADRLRTAARTGQDQSGTGGSGGSPSPSPTSTRSPAPSPSPSATRGGR